MPKPETNETARAATLTVSSNPNFSERILPMTMVQSRMKINPATGVLAEVHDCLTLALDASERPSGYSQSEREARSYVRSALRRVGKLMEGVA